MTGLLPLKWYPFTDIKTYMYLQFYGSIYRRYSILKNKAHVYFSNLIPRLFILNNLSLAIHRPLAKGTNN